jgi:hypothetical protein
VRHDVADASVGCGRLQQRLSGEASVKAEVLALDPFASADTGVRLMSEMAYVIARA